jgi:hypothetical protein
MKNNDNSSKFIRDNNELLNDDYIINGLSDILNNKPLKYKFGIEKRFSYGQEYYYLFIKNDEDLDPIKYNPDDKPCLSFRFIDEAKGITIYINMITKCAPIKNYGNFILTSIKEFAKTYGYYSVLIGSDGSVLPFTFIVNGEEKEIYVELAYLNILSTGESWYNKMGFYTQISREQIEENKYKISQNIESIDDSIKIIDLINSKLQRYKGRENKMPICYKIISSYGNFRELYNFILEITDKSGTNSIQEVFQEVTNFIRKNCDSVNEICSIDYLTLQKISCFIDFIYELLGLQYKATSLIYIVPKNIYNVKSGKSTKKNRKLNNKTKKQFLYNPDNPKKSFDVYIDKNPNDTINIKYTTVNDVKNTIKKLERLYKNKKYTHKRIWQVGMIMKVRLEVLKDKKPKQFEIANKYFKFLGERTKLNEIDRHKFKFKI